MTRNQKQRAFHQRQADITSGPLADYFARFVYTDPEHGHEIMGEWVSVAILASLQLPMVPSPSLAGVVKRVELLRRTPDERPDPTFIGI